MAARGKTSVGWFFGLELHVVISHAGELLAVRVTEGNRSDLSQVPDLTKGLLGLLFGDKGYIGRKCGRSSVSVPPPPWWKFLRGYATEGGGAGWSGGVVDLPVVGQKFFGAVDGVGGDSPQHVGGVVPQVEIGAAGGFDEGDWRHANRIVKSVGSGQRTRYFFNVLTEEIRNVPVVTQRDRQPTRRALGKDRWFHYDQVGSVMLATNASAAVADTRHADAFGNEMASWTSGAWTDSLAERSGRGHNTKKLDSDTGLVYMYQRWYLPEAGIFVSKASYPPMVEHRYEFVEADPTAANDPHGEFMNFVIGAVAGVVTGYALALLTGECYDWGDAATDAAMGAVGAGLLSKANKLARISNARKIARKDGMELKSFDRRTGMEKWDNGNGRTTIKHKPSKNAPESNYPRVEYQPARGGPRKDPFTGESGIKNGPAGHARLEPVTPGRSGAAGAGGALLNPNPSDCP